MKQVVTTGIILGRIDFGEADLILTVLTPDQGKLRVMAKGVRKVKSKLAGGIELFSISSLTLIEGRSDIRTLVSSRLQQHFANIAKDINRTMFGYEALKAVAKITEDYAGGEYFETLRQTLAALDNSQLSLDSISLWLYVQLLSQAGHTPDLRTDGKGNQLEAGQKFSFDYDTMTFVPMPRGRYDDRHIKLLRLAKQANDPAVFVQLKDADKQIEQALGLARQLASQHLSV
jgi:DNA repair protein RecO (recombination protein O)